MNIEKTFGTDEKIQEKAILAGLDTGEYDAEESISELRELADTAGAQCVATVLQKRDAPCAATCLGEGKLNEIKNIIEIENANLVIFDLELSGSQIRNIEKILDVKIIDRTMLILDIFAQHAKSAQGKLQVELAQQKYLLPRLIGLGAVLSRQGGGIGTRGPGESALESDKRHIRERIDNISKKLKESEKNRDILRRQRKRSEFLTVAIVGYTNVGKSTLLNYLTNAGVLCENKLFATLDPTARALKLPDERTVILVDTVGLVSRLPHALVEAFHSTLSEASEADLILNVCDISSKDAQKQLSLTQEVLNDLGAKEIPVLHVLNKADVCGIDEGAVNTYDNVIISAKTGMGIDKMLSKICSMLKNTHTRIKLLIPYDKGGLIGEIRKNGKVFEEEYRDGAIYIDILCDNQLLYKCKSFIFVSNPVEM